MKVLILSKEAWREDQNGGNVLSNIFSGFDAEFAQVYCTEAEPSNKVCKLYFQMTDRMMVNNILRWKAIGKIKEYEDYPKYTSPVKESFSGTKRLNWIGVPLARELVWKLARWNNTSLKNFIKNFNPDVIFAPCYGTHYMIKLTKIAKKICDVPVISYISDDFYTNNQINYDPLFWINHFWMRWRVRQVFKLYDLVYTMTDEQKEQCERDLHANMKILRKSGLFEKSKEKTIVHDPIRFIYGGSLYINRWVTLSALAKAMREVNKDGVRMVLDIYTNYDITPEINSNLNDGITSKIHPAVSMKELNEIYANSDVALHVEGFDKKNAFGVRLSFSTKIVDCMDSGCAVMAICEEHQAGLAYLKRNDAAICLTNVNDIKPTLENILNNREILVEYQHKAFELGRKNHMEEDTRKMLENDFRTVMNHE